MTSMTVAAHLAAHADSPPYLLMTHEHLDPTRPIWLAVEAGVGYPARTESDAASYIEVAGKRGIALADWLVPALALRDDRRPVLRLVEFEASGPEPVSYAVRIARWIRRVVR